MSAQGQPSRNQPAVRDLWDALATEDTSERARALEKGKARVLEAVGKKRQDGSSAAWYTLAQLYLYQGDVVGADTALRRAEAISPKCAGVFEGVRYRVWAPLVNAGAAFVESKADDSALAAFREAGAIYPEQPQPFLSGGVILANRGQPDSAIVWFRRAASAAEKREMPEVRDQATYNLAVMLQRGDRHAEAAAALERYLGWSPGQADAKRMLANSYRALGRTPDARRLERELGESGDTTAAGGAPLVSEQAMRAGVDFYNAQRWKEAAEMFERAAAASPHSRDALFALASTSLALENGPKLLEVAERLVALDPLNADVLGLLGAGYKLTRQIDRAVGVATRLLALGTSISVERLMVAADSATLTGTATGRAAQAATGKRLHPDSAGVVFEFTDQRGEVVASQGLMVPALEPGTTHPISLRVAGKGIVAWRYRPQ